MSDQMQAMAVAKCPSCGCQFIVDGRDMEQCPNAKCGAMVDVEANRVRLPKGRGRHQGRRRAR